jgi:pentatricopeptide repeat protein
MRFFSIHLFPVFFAIVLMASCESQHMSLSLQEVEAFLQDRPDSALAALRALDTTKLNTRALRAHYALLYAMALDKNWIDTTDPGIILPAVSYYDRHHSLARRAKAFYYLGRIQYNGGQYDSAILSFTHAREYSKKLEDPRFKALILQAIGDTYGKVYLFEEAYAMSDSAYHYSLVAGDTALAGASHYRMAQNLNNLRRYNEAVELYDSLLNDPWIQANRRVYARTFAGYALAVLNDSDDCEKAGRLFEQSLATGVKFDSYTHWGAYAYCLFKNGSVDKACRIFEKMEKAGVGEQYAYQKWRSRVERLSGNSSEAYALLEISAERQTARTREILHQSVIKAQRDYLDMQNKYLHEKESRRRLFGLILICLLLFVVFCLWQYWRKKIAEAQEKQEILLQTVNTLIEQVDKEKTTSLLKENRFLTRYAELFHMYLQQMGAIRDMLRNCQTEAGVDQLLGSLKRQVNKLSLDKAKQQRFEAMLNTELNGVMAHYREEFSGQEEEEYRLVSFLFAGFDVSTICALVGNRTKQAIYSKKSKLRQRIAKGSSPYKEDYLRALG